MDKVISSLSPASLYWQLMAGVNSSHHRGPLPVEEEAPESLDRMTVRLLITMVSVKQVARRVKGGEAMVRAMGDAVDSTVDRMFNSIPGDDATNQVPPGWYFHHGPNPYLVAADLTQYANVLTDQTAKADYSGLVDTIASRITQLITT
jgi:hypothetical protein